MPFPPGFLFGTANADHQVEAHDPAREDVWDLWERCQGLTQRGQGTDFANRYPEDIAAAAGLGCKLFRFSVAWSRVETSEGHFDAGALAAYRRIAQTIRDHGMQVMVTLHHFVWPVWLERDHRGMIGREFPDLFARYAGKVATAFGDLVDFWITFNEPSQLTFGYIKPWWQNRYYMPPGMPRGTDVDSEAAAVGKLIPALFLAHARARKAVKALHPQTKVGVNPLVTGFPTWLQMLMDWGACHRRLSEAVFKFTTANPLVSEKGGVDLVIGGVTAEEQTRFEYSDPYVRTGKAILVLKDYAGADVNSLSGKRVGVIGIGNQPAAWNRNLPSGARKILFADYQTARDALKAGEVEAVHGDAFFLLPAQVDDGSAYRFLITGLSEESYVVVVPHGHVGLLALVDRSVAAFQKELSQIDPGSSPGSGEARKPVSLHDVFHEEAVEGTSRPLKTRDLKRIRRRGHLRIGIRTDAPGMSSGCRSEGPEIRLAKEIARQVMGNEEMLEIVPIEPVNRLKVLQSPSGWLNWAWRFWGTVSLIANANWWYLGTSGRLPEELCPQEAVGAQDFVGLDYYWGLPTWKLSRFRTLDDAAHGRFLKAPVWPRGLFHALQRFHRWFPDQELFIVENGSVPVANGMSRSDYLRVHLQQVEAALAKGVPVKGYNYWSITSNREWGHAFDPNTDFGLYFVDLDKDPDLKRQETKDAVTYREIIAAGTAG
jgi:beta-glucosidase/6-phospho-beta-glucosidase/beta-galactosidase/ABC-type amino acid transport substrate-binding protein